MAATQKDSTRKTENDHLAETRARLLEAALPEVCFDGWTEKTLEIATEASGVDKGLAKLAFPRGGVDLALYFHYDGDRKLAEEMAAAPLAEMKIRERVAFGVRRRLEMVAGEREAVRRGVTLLALPLYAADGAKAIWNTADVIWTGLGDTSTDYNWYSKRTILSGVYSSTVLFWLGDDSEDFSETWAFLDRRIEDVMRFEKAKAKLRGNKAAKALFWGPSKLLERVSAPGERRDVDTGTGVGLPG